jgi:hypothetical protein
MSKINIHIYSAVNNYSMTHYNLQFILSKNTAERRTLVI